MKLSMIVQRTSVGPSAFMGYRSVKECQRINLPRAFARSLARASSISMQPLRLNLLFKYAVKRETCTRKVHLAQASSLVQVLVGSHIDRHTHWADCVMLAKPRHAYTEIIPSHLLIRNSHASSPVFASSFADLFVSADHLPDS